MDYKEEFIIYLLEKDRSQKTIETYISDLEMFFEYYTKQIINITKADIIYYKQFLKNSDLHIKTINKKLSSLRQYIAFLNEKYNYNILLYIPYEKLQKQEYLDDVLTDEEFNKLISASEQKNDIRAKTIFYTLYLTGVRVSELIQIKLSDIQKDYITIKGKGNKYRDIFVAKKLKAIWQEYINCRIEKSDCLFTGKHGALTRHGINYIIKQYTNIAGVDEKKLYAHNFRHYYGISLAKRNFNLDVIADLMGHSDVNITRIYTRRSKRELLEAINEL